VHILVVDDQPHICHLARVILGSLGHAVIVAENGRQALLRLEETPIEVLVTDMQMPETDGLALIAAVRQRFPAIVIIVISAWADEGLRGLEAGARLFVAKPFSYAALAAGVAAALTDSAPDG
jgi:CheY-like chemotaxis protein